MAKAHVPDDNSRLVVQNYAVAGIPNHDIAPMIGLSIKTLLKHYKHELAYGKQILAGKAVGAIAKRIEDGDLAAAIFYCKTQLQWRETGRENESEDLPPPATININVKQPND